jgi:hypothetical protein
VVRVFRAALGVAGALAGGRCSRLEPFQHRLREHQPLRGRIHVAEPCRGVELALGILQRSSIADLTWPAFSDGLTRTEDGCGSTSAWCAYCEGVGPTWRELFLVLLPDVSGGM